MPSVGVVVPAYDPDVETLVGYVAEVHEALNPERVHVELDAPSGGTADRVRDAEASVNVVGERRGKGAAVTAGFERLDTDVLAFADADGSTDAASLRRVVERVSGGGVDLAVGSRRHPDTPAANHQTVVRRFLGDGFAWLARRLLDVELYDYQCGAKAIDAAGWERVRHHLYEPGFAWDVELVAVAGGTGLRVAEVPVAWNDEPGSTVSTVRTPVSLFRALLVARRRANRLRDARSATPAERHASGRRALVEREL